MIPLIGTLHSYVKTWDLQQKAALKQKNAGKEQKKEKTEMDYLRESLGDTRKSWIQEKMKMGKKLAPDEMEYLRKTDPNAYAQAVRIKQEREAYEKAIKSCRTKAQAQQAHLWKIQALAQDFREAKTSGNVEATHEVSMRINAINDEYLTFTSSKEYQALPKDDEERRERRRKKGLPGQRSGNVIVQLSTVMTRMQERPQTVEPPSGEKTGGGKVEGGKIGGGKAGSGKAGSTA